MAPAAYAATATELTAPVETLRSEASFRVARAARRLRLFNAAPTPGRLFHAWRP